MNFYLINKIGPAQSSLNNLFRPPKNSTAESERDLDNYKPSESFSRTSTGSNVGDNNISYKGSGFHSLNRISLVPPNNFPVQPKLRIGAPNDKYEKEADRVADQVMRMPQAKIRGTPGPINIQKKCAACEQEEKAELLMKPLASQITPLIKRKSVGEILRSKTEAGVPSVTSLFQNKLNSSKGGGSPLPQSTNQFFSSAFGMDFSHVRIHTGGRAHQMNSDIQARAFTQGSDVYFNKGQYSPESSEGKRLLAHELTHVVQQRGDHLKNAVLPPTRNSGIASSASRLIQRIPIAPAVAEAIKALTFAEAITAVGTVVSSATSIIGLVGAAQNDRTGVSNDSILVPSQGDYLMSDLDRDSLAQVFRVGYFYEAEQLLSEEQSRGTVLDDAKKEEVKQTAMLNTKLRITNIMSGKLRNTTEAFVQQGDGGTSKETPWGEVTVRVLGGRLNDVSELPAFVEVARRYHVTVPERTLQFIKRVKLSFECEKDWNLTWNDDIWVRGTKLAATQDSGLHVGIEAEVAFDWDGDTTRYEWDEANLITFNNIPQPLWRGPLDPDD